MTLRPNGCDQQGRYKTRSSPRVHQVAQEGIVQREQRQAGLRDDDTIPEPTATRITDLLIALAVVGFFALVAAGVV
jgi:hypothetical protein